MNSFMPLNESLIGPALDLFNTVSNAVSSFVACIAMMRLCYLILTVGSAGEYANVIKDIVKYFILISLFPIVLKLLLFGISDIAKKIAFASSDISVKQVEEAFDNLFSDYAILSLFGKIGFSVIQKLAESIFSALISLLIAVAPVFIFTNTLIALQSGIQGYASVILSLSIWPVLWNILGKLAITILAHSASASWETAIFWLSILFLQLCSPFFCYSLFRSMSLGSVIGSSLGVAMTGSKIGTWAVRQRVSVKFPEVGSFSLRRKRPNIEREVFEAHTRLNQPQEQKNLLRRK